MKKIITLAIVFLLVLPTFSVFLPRVQAESTFGKTVQGATRWYFWYWFAKVVNRFQAPEDGEITNITFYGLPVGSGMQFRAVVYGDNAGVPDALLASGNQVPLSISEGWQSAPISLNVTGGTYYWIGIQYTGNGRIDFWYDPGAPSQTAFNIDAFDPDDPFGTPSYEDYELSIYATYTPSGPKTWTVDDDRVECPDADFTSIQEAINASRSGDTVYVCTGTYYEHLVVNKTLSLVGVDRNTVIIDGNGTGTIVSIASMTSNVVIREFTIRNGWQGIGIVHSSRNTIFGNKIVNNTGAGINLFVSDGNISRNRLENNSVGISLSGGVALISENNIYNNSHGLTLGAFSSANITGNNITQNTHWGVSVSKSGISASRNNIENNYFGIYFGGLYSYGNVSENKIANNSIGVSMHLQSFTTISENNITDNDASGISLELTSSHEIYRNTLSNNGIGAYLHSSSDNVISGNDFTNNLVGLNHSNSYNNTIYDNNFINNTVQVPSIVDSFNNNWNTTYFWNGTYRSGGNFWSDYTGPDLSHGPFQNIPGSDGIGDTPYIIDSNNTDHYPLMGIGWPPSTPTIFSPNGGEFWSGTQIITWSNSTDPDEDPVTYEIEYSLNNGTNWTTLATGIPETSYNWNTTLYPDSNNYLVRVRAHDGLQVSYWDQSDSAFMVDNTDPLVQILYPTENQIVTAGTIWVNGTVTELNKGALQPSIVSIPNANFSLVQWDGSAFAFKNTSIIIVGPMSVNVSFSDLAGNTGQNTMSFSYSPFGEETELSVSVTPSSALVGYEVEIVGRLTWLENGTGIADAPILVSYQYHPDLMSYIPAGQSWNVISTVTTTADGSYSATWFVMSSGIYRIEAFYPGSAQAYSATSTASLLIADLEGKIFSVTSNSTVSNMNFNSTAKEIKFTVSGLNGTVGYLDMFLAKSLVSDVSELKIYFDGVEKSYEAISVDDTWLIRLTYTHSTHTVRITLSHSISPIVSRELMIITVGIAVIGSIIAVLLLRKKRRKRVAASSLQREKWPETGSVPSKKLTL